MSFWLLASIVAVVSFGLGFAIRYVQTRVRPTWRNRR